jgi:hypothetical protein
MAEEIKEIRREFLGPDEEIKYYIAAPTAEDVRGADWQYSKTYTKSLTEGITTNAEMMDILMQRGIVGPEFEQRATELTELLNEKIRELANATDVDEKRELAIEVSQFREELFQWNQRLNGPMSNTCEQMADDARLEYLTSCIVQTEDGTKVWKSYDDFLKEKSQALALRARFEVMLFLQGLESNFLEQTPEAQAMKEVENDAIEKAQAAYKAAQAIEEEEKEVEKSSNKSNSKKTSKSSSKSKKGRGRPKKEGLDE